eukprot:UN24860
MSTNQNPTAPHINIFGISNHGTDINFSTNPAFAGYKTNDFPRFCFFCFAKLNSFFPLLFFSPFLKKGSISL